MALLSDEEGLEMGKMREQNTFTKPEWTRYADDANEALRLLQIKSKRHDDGRRRTL